MCLRTPHRRSFIALGLSALGLLATACDANPANPQGTAGIAPPASATAPSSAPSAPTSSLRFVPAPSGGDLLSWIIAQRQEARQAGEQLVVYEGAPWCEPCQRFHEAAERGTLDGQLPPIRFLQFSADTDHDRLAAIGYSSKLVPLFALPGDDGRGTGAQISGSVKGPGAPRQIAPRLTALLAGREP